MLSDKSVNDSSMLRTILRTSYFRIKLFISLMTIVNTKWLIRVLDLFGDFFDEDVLGTKLYEPFFLDIYILSVVAIVLLQLLNSNKNNASV